MTFVRRTLDRWLGRWLDRWFLRLAPPPLAAWGKLPTHADYLQYRAGADAARDWQAWLGRFAPTPRRPAPAGWLQLEPAPPDLQALPVAFVLPPGVLAFAGRRYVAGVMVPSQDSVGRAHPLIVWRCVDVHWLDAQAVAGLPWWHAQAQLLERLALRAAAFDDDGPAAAETRRADSAWDWHRLCDLATQLDAAPPPGAAALQRWLAEQLPVPRPSGADAGPPPVPSSHYLHGVRHLPWPQWPGGDHAAARHAAFWQQDGEGRIVAASASLAGVFRQGRRGR
ncbi:MAG: type VI secretion system-associated protein TagF [Burkholderiales bacterium]|nr:type VI secretion system-associated protein TagF [Burkholderiales bacterium]